MERIAFIVQARSGSTRLPNKVLLPFYKGKSILQLLIEKLKDNFEVPVIVATTNNKADDKIVEVSKENNVFTYRGHEDEVLKRFIESAEQNNVNNIVRICSDNPFLSVSFLKELLESWESNYDYLSFQLSDQTPSILTQYGFWAEMVSLKALKIADEAANIGKENREHVTSYLYQNPQLFNVNFLKIPAYIENQKNIRLTLDTQNDFINQQKIYSELVKYNSSFDVADVIEYLQNNIQFYDKMQIEYKKNKKQ